MSEHRDPVWQSEADASIAGTVRSYCEVRELLDEGQAVQADFDRRLRSNRYDAERDHCAAIVRAAKVAVHCMAHGKTYTHGDEPCCEASGLAAKRKL